MNDKGDENSRADDVDKHWEVLPPRSRPAFHHEDDDRFDTRCRRTDVNSDMIATGVASDVLQVLVGEDTTKHNDDNDDDDSDTESYIEERIRQVQEELKVLKKKEVMLQEKIVQKKQDKEEATATKQSKKGKKKKRKGRAPRKSTSKMIREQQWMEMYSRLRKYKETYGVEPPTHCPEDPKLGTWVNNQRRRKRLANQPQHRLMLLQNIQFEFNGNVRSANAPPKKYRKRIKLPENTQQQKDGTTTNVTTTFVAATDATASTLKRNNDNDKLLSTSSTTTNEVIV